MRRLILIALYFEIGFVLIVVPWSAYWDRNYFAQALPLVHAVITNNFIRGAVSGLGLLNVVLGLVEVFRVVARRRAERPASIAPSTLAEE